MTTRWMSFRCRFGLHSWKDIACPDGQYLRTCARCLRTLGPFAQYQRQAPRDDLRDYLSG